MKTAYLDIFRYIKTILIFDKIISRSCSDYRLKDFEFKMTFKTIQKKNLQNTDQVLQSGVHQGQLL